MGNDESPLSKEQIGIIAHSLRTPLTSVMGFAVLILNRDLTPEKAKEWARVIYDSSLESLRAAEQIIAYNTALAGLNKGVKVIDVGAALDSVVLKYKNQFPERKFVLESSANNAVPMRTVNGSVAGILEQLVSNAIIYSPPDTEIAMGVISAPEEVTVYVRNEKGIGISPAEKANLFMPFYHPEGFHEDSKHVLGIGLGLAIAQLLARQNNGRIVAESDGLGKGATFYLKLPREQQGRLFE